MNKVIKEFALAVSGSLMLLGNPAVADHKMATVDIEAIAQRLPEVATIHHTIQSEFKDQINAITKMQADAKYKYDKLQREGATLSTAQQDALKKAILAQQKEVESRSKPLQEQMKRRGTEERNKILAKVQKAIAAVAINGGYDVVLHKASVAFMANGESTDISGKVAEHIKKP